MFLLKCEVSCFFKHFLFCLLYFRGVSHSAMTDMQTIEQEGIEDKRFSSMDKFERRNNKNSFFEDEVESFSSGYSSGPPK